MRRFTHRPTVVLALGAALVGLGLGGCTTPTAPVVVPASPSATPVFASDEEALAAAKDAYAKYLEVADQIASDGGTDPERIASFVTKDRLETELKGSASLAAQKLRITGKTSFDVIDLQRVGAVGEETEVAFYACWDASGVRVIDAGGNDVTPPDRVDRQELEVVFTTDHGKIPLLLESDDVWPGDSSC